MTAREQIKQDEGLRLTAYRDTVGKTTIGYGRNLDDVGISRDEADYLFASDLARVQLEVARKIPWSTNLSDPRQAVLINMAFNMGIAGLLKFHDTLSFAQQGLYAMAAVSMMKSLWAKQVGERAVRLAKQMETGQWVGYDVPEQGSGASGAK